jgi:uncharacterized protein (TIGR02271 family)
MIGVEHIHSLSGRELHDRDGNKIGTVGQIWDDGAGRPGWASVRTGLFGMNESLVPLNDAELRDDQVVVPFDKATVKDAPNVDASQDEPLGPDEVDRLYQHYGMSWEDSSRAYDAGAAATNAGYSGTADASGAGYEGTTGTRYESTSDTGYEGTSGAGYEGTSGAGYEGTTGADRTDVSRGERYRDEADSATGRGEAAGADGMTRSEERLNVGKEREQVGRARLRKYVVTERQQVDVPVEREQVRLEREPITDANRDAAYDGADITESEHEVTLHAERPVVDTETVPVERVRLGKETVTEQQNVGGDVRKERIEADLPDEDGRRNLD